MAGCAKLTVAVLKTELSSRGLPTSGNKAVLVARLEEALAAITANEVAVKEAVEEPKEIVETMQETVVETVVEEVAEHVVEVSEATEKVVKTPANSAVTVDAFEEAKKARAARFGVPYIPPKMSEEEEKKAAIAAQQKILKARAERFGLPQAQAEIQAAKLKARQERFGIINAETEKKNKRGKATPVVDEGLEIKKRQRAERFGIKTAKMIADEEEAKKLKRAQRFAKS